MDFKVWLETRSKSDEYQKYWAPLFGKLPPNPRFESWFPKGQDRIYIPINISKSDFNNQSIRQSDELKKEVKAVLLKGGYRILNWGEGICKDKKGRRMEITHALAELGDVETKRKYTDFLMDQYSSYPVNPKRNKFLVVISRNPHDLATMSTGRHWGSCISLKLDVKDTPEGRRVKDLRGTGEHDDRGNEIKQWVDVPQEDEYNYKRLKTEILEGGLVAYLTTSEDKELRKPLARLHLPRYEDVVSGKTFLYCKQDQQLIYGKRQLEFFVKVVENWLKEKQGEGHQGRFDKKGGSWIEGTPYEITNLTKIDEDYFKKAIEYYEKSGTGNGEYLAEKYVEAALKILQQEWTISDKFWNWLKDKIFSKYQGQTYYLRDLAKKHPDKVNNWDIFKLKTPSEFFGRSTFGGYGDGYHKYQEWIMGLFNATVQEELTDKSVDTMFKIINQIKYGLSNKPGELERVFAWGRKLMGSNNPKWIKVYVDWILDCRYALEIPKVYKEMNWVLERGYKYIPQDDWYKLEFYVSDLKKQGLEPPRIEGFEV